MGREGTCGGGPKGSGEAPGLEGTGGAPPRLGPPAGGGPGAGPRDPGLVGGTAGALLCGVGLEVGDLPRERLVSWTSRRKKIGSLYGLLQAGKMEAVFAGKFVYTAWFTPPFQPPLAPLG